MSMIKRLVCYSKRLKDLPVAYRNWRDAKFLMRAGMLDSEWYLSKYPDVRKSGIRPALHYIQFGWREGRNPNADFMTDYYLETYPDVRISKINPAIHYLRHGQHEKRKTKRETDATSIDEAVSTTMIYDAVSFATDKGPMFEEFDSTASIGRNPRTKIITYYLPQFHTIPENDTHWGKGFTEWTNISRALPRFKGHIQPKIPRDLGFYNLSDTSSVMKKQIELAKAAGVFGFCFYYYWFDGKRVLQTPVENFLADKSLDFPFCIMWANENWTKTWDGHEKDVILAQNYYSNDDEAFMADWARHINDPRYIKINGKPIVFIYRPNQIPEAKEAISRWRNILLQKHGLDVYIFMAQGFGSFDPREFGLDGAIEFPPHKLTVDTPNIVSSKELYNSNYKGRVISYDDVVDRSTREEPHGYPLIRTVVPQWDNEARRPGRGTVIHGSTPEKFESWLRYCIHYARTNPIFEENIVAINAWNEWAEGAYLEPDVHYGAAYLNAVARAVYGHVPRLEEGRLKVVIISHDAHKNGAQTLALKIGQTLRAKFGVSVAYIIAGDGPLIPDFQDVGVVEVVNPDSTKDVWSAVTRLFEAGFHIAIANTTASGAIVPSLKSKGFSVVSLIHELPNLIKNYKIEDSAQSIASDADCIVFPANIVKDGFKSIVHDIIGRVDILPQGLYREELLSTIKRDGGIRNELGFSDESKIVIGAGYADLRKGVDRFIATALI